jgi:hypothetical protein
MRRVPVLVSAALLALFAVLFVRASKVGVPGLLDPVRHLAVEEAKIRETMIDPESVRFRNDFVSRLGLQPVVCGEINYKNSLGGYVGYQQFIWGPDVHLFGIDTQADEMKRQWEARCKRP